VIQYGRRNSIVAHWLCSEIDLIPTDDFRCLANCTTDGRILGAVGYDRWNGASCEIHVAGRKGWLTPDFLTEALDYPFNTCNLELLFGIVPSGNMEALEFDKKLGFQELAVVPHAHPDGALHILTLRKEAWAKSQLLMRLTTRQQRKKLPLQT
jgi:hypothetical protein